MVQNDSNGLPIRVTLQFEYWTAIVSGILLSGIGMVTVMFLFFVQDAVLGVETDRGSNGGGQGKSRYLPPHLRGKPGDIFISILQPLSTHISTKS